MIPNRKPVKVKVKPASSSTSRIDRTGPIKRGRSYGHSAQPAKVSVPRVGQLPVQEPAGRPKTSTVQPIWRGETCFIIGGGPSLTGLDWNRLAGKRTIAINKALLSYPNADVLYWTDSRFYSWHKLDIDRFKGLKYAIRFNATHNGEVQLLNRGMRFGLETRADTLAHGNNSGYAAINLAYHLGAKRIVLLGYDMGNVGGKSHFHDGYATRATSDEIYQKQFIPGFDFLAAELKKKGVEVLNACPTSKLTAFPRISLDRGLGLG